MYKQFLLLQQQIEDNQLVIDEKKRPEIIRYAQRMVETKY